MEIVEYSLFTKLIVSHRDYLLQFFNEVISMGSIYYCNQTAAKKLGICDLLFPAQGLLPKNLNRKLQLTKAKILS